MLFKQLGKDIVDKAVNTKLFSPIAVTLESITFSKFTHLTNVSFPRIFICETSILIKDEQFENTPLTL